MADQNDYTQNVNIWNDAKSKAVSIVTDGPIERLAVDANVTGGVTLQRFTSKSLYSLANTALNTVTDTTLFTLTLDGQMEFVAIAGSISSYEIAIFIDGIEELRITMNDLGSVIGLANATNVPMWVETANKNFRFSPKTPVDFTTSFQVKAKALSGTPTVNWLVVYRELS